MICCSFIFTPAEYDEDFHRLDGEIANFARSLPGFDRVERWQSSDGATRNSMYFFADRESVNELARFSEHREAKGRVDEWYLGYRVDIFEQTASYGKNPEALNTGTD